MATSDERLDPRVQVELEKLNTATDDINKLEAKLEEANYVFRTTLTESTARLKALAKKLGNCIEKARPFYEAQELARSSQLECQRAAVQYQRANALHQAAKETIALAEERFVNSRHEHWQFDSAWQEMLNHATMKVMEAEAQKAASEREHMRRAAAFTQAEQRVQQLQRGLKSSINKSLVYFDEKNAIQSQLETLKERVQQLQKAIASSKSTYAQSLRNLEQISEEIHEQRRCKLPREPGVGAELTPPEVSNAQCFDFNGKSFTPLEEITAKDEKYWETLREKLERLQMKNQNNLSAEKDNLSDMEFPDGRERTVTGSSCASDRDFEHSYEVERIISGESSTGSESEGPLSPYEGKESFEEGNENTRVTVADKDKANAFGFAGSEFPLPEGYFNAKRTSKEISLEQVRIKAKNVEKIGDRNKKYETTFVDEKMNTNHETPTDVPLDLRTKGRVLPVHEVDNEGYCLNSENDNVNGVNNNCDIPSAHSVVKEHAEPTLPSEQEVILEDIDDSDLDEINMNIDNNNECDARTEKETGDGASSPPPAMCQPVKGLSAIPEAQET
ncbi:SH3 domain-binding protein 5 [Halocaridina rubra]|uniref:SH3 domain-binding protein 5 n=1 Tax=Halocaridina rubra TaxID=373956 RepID=A0AAN9A9D0_HALRR